MKEIKALTEQDIDNINHYIEKHGFDEKIQKLQNAILSSDNVHNIKEFAKNIIGANIVALQDALIKTKNASSMSEFARFVKGADVGRLQKEVIESKDPDAIEYFAAHVRHADVKLLEDLIIKSGRGNLIYSFAKEVGNADMANLAKAMASTNDYSNIREFALLYKNNAVVGEYLLEAMENCRDAHYIYFYALLIPESRDRLSRAMANTGNAEKIYEYTLDFFKDVNLKVLSEGMAKTHNAKYIVKMACEMDADIDVLKEGILKTHDSYYIFYFTSRNKKLLSEDDIKRLFIRTIETGNADEIYRFKEVFIGDKYDFKDVVEGNKKVLEKLEESIIKSENPDYILDLAINVPNSNKIKLSKAIIRTESSNYIYKFARDVEGADVKLLQDSIIQGGKSEFIYLFANYVKGADVEELQKAIIKNRSEYFIKKFKENVKGASTEKLRIKSLEEKIDELIY